MSDREQRIRERAHAMWLDEGQPAGEHERHWEAACREIDAQVAASTDTDPAPAAPQAPKPKRAPRAKAASDAAPVKRKPRTPKA